MLDAWQQFANWGIAGPITQWHAEQARELALTGLIDVPAVPVSLPDRPGGYLDLATIVAIRARPRFRLGRTR